jgi:RimJ/RimL family protein N-acetyltransferase
MRSTDTPHVVVVMGGTDAAGVLRDAVRAVTTASRTARVTAVCPDVDLYRELHGDRVVLHPPSPDLVGVFETADLVVTAAGTTVGELCVMGVPMALTPVADNQIEAYQAAITSKVAVGLGDPSLLLEEAPPLLEAVLGDPSHRAELARNALRLVDGAGSARILAAIEMSVFQSPGPVRPRRLPLDARKAVTQDGPLLFAWRNDVVTRRFSRNSSEVAQGAHAEWLRQSLDNPSRHLLVVEDAAASPVGTARWDRDRHRENRWEISVTLGPEYRSKGFGSTLIAAAEQWLIDHETDAVEMLAVIHTANAASRKLFGSCGYSGFSTADTEGFLSFRKPILPSTQVRTPGPAHTSDNVSGVPRETS